ncbi:hypothetical protein AB0P45_15965 [Streptomyces niveus]|uniref:hypothetical protein n=1 Tax=Streptomyces niveus TaxID=193462 RepID=UPI0034189F61
MAGIERPELLPDCDASARHRAPDDVVLTCLVRLADDSLADNLRTTSLHACEIRGGAALAAGSFMVQAPGPWHDELQRILRMTGVNVDRPHYSYAEYTVGLCYVAGAKGLPAGLRHRAADALVHRANDVGYAEARNLLPKNGWEWLTDAVRDGWAVWTANLFAKDETAPLTTRMRVGLALAEYEHETGYVPGAVEQLVAHPGATSADRLALAMAMAQRAPKDATSLLRCLASDPIVQVGHRMQVIGRLDEIDPSMAETMRAIQTRLPAARVARDQHRDAAEHTQRESAAQRQRETPKAVVDRLDSKVEELLDDLRGRGSADWLGDQLDNHIAETDWEGVTQDIADIRGVVCDDENEASLRLLEALTQIRFGGERSSTPDTLGLDAQGDQDFPQLTQEELGGGARAEAERSWEFWRKLVEKHGWDDEDDHSGELDRQMDEVNQNVGASICERAGNHLRALQQHLVWELWPTLVNAAEKRDYAAARGCLATARLLADEAERAEALWKKATVADYSFDPLTMSWPRDFWLVLEKWRGGTAAP